MNGEQRTGTPRVVLLDIEGTTTPVTFVYDVLFPYARQRVRAFLERHAGEPGVSEDLAALRGEHERDRASEPAPPPWLGTGVAPAAAYVHWLMDRDRKSTGLKALQGRIWRDGYESGALRGTLYLDVVPAIDRWRAGGLRVCIFSSGSVLAQKLLFGHTTEGDLTPRLAGYFDTTSGPKKEAASYRAIAAELGVETTDVLFVSDIVAELDAAREAGAETRHCIRPGTPVPEPPTHPTVETFDEIEL